MATAILITEPWEIAACLPWAAHFANARQEGLLVLLPVLREGDARVERLDLQSMQPAEDASKAASEVGRAVVRYVANSKVLKLRIDEHPLPESDGSEVASESPQRTLISALELYCADPAEAVLKQIGEGSIKLLILPRHLTERGLDPEREMEHTLFEEAPCETVRLRPGLGSDSGLRRILVPAGGGAPSLNAIRAAIPLAKIEDAKVTTLYVEPKVDDLAERVGQRIAKSIVSSALDAEELPHVTSRTIVDDRVADGVKRLAADYDLILVGASRRGIVRRWTKRSVTAELLAGCPDTVVAVLRPSIPFASRVRRTIERQLKSIVPQLSRQQRVSLVERLQTSSQWDFDFITLICLSTLIAALGLMQNSASVVIGAMLVAPLMTPLIGAGLSLAQGNLALIRNASKSVVLGFILAFAIGFILGLMPGTVMTEEIRARCFPNLRDFVVAFISGVAAAYALGRPNLLSALPGVAIAAALVPPIATAGITAALGRWELAVGALLLFLTNIVVIILGTTCSLWLVGVRGSHAHGDRQNWAARFIFVLAVIALILAVFETVPGFRVRRDGVAEQLVNGLQAEIEQQVTRYPNTQCRGVMRTPLGIHVIVARPTPAPPQLSIELAQLVQNRLDEPIQIELETRLVESIMIESVGPENSTRPPPSHLSR